VALLQGTLWNMTDATTMSITISTPMATTTAAATTTTTTISYRYYYLLLLLLLLCLERGIPSWIIYPIIAVSDTIIGNHMGD